VLSAGFAVLDAWTFGEGARVLASVMVALVASLVLRLRKNLLMAKGTRLAPGARLIQLVWTRNLVVTLASLALVILWGYKLTGFVFSLAAVAGALVIVNKELLQGLAGYAVLTITQPYKVGDYVSVGGVTGRVIDIRIFATTLAETGSVHQLTGMTVTVPHASILTESVRNMSATGAYQVNLFRMVVPFDFDLAAAETVALAAAEEVTAPWRDAAEAHLLSREEANFIDLPSARPKVLWESLDSRSTGVLIRFTCPADKRVVAEQEIFRIFWRDMRVRVAAEKEKSPEQRSGD